MTVGLQMTIRHVKTAAIMWQVHVTDMEVIRCTQSFSDYILVQPLKSTFVCIVAHTRGPVFMCALCSITMTIRQVECFPQTTCL
jgi:hypothetical protein